MWWEILPSASIISAAAILPYAFNYVSNLLAYDTPYHRQVGSITQTATWFRDARINKTGLPYKQIGLDNLDQYCTPITVKEEIPCVCPPGTVPPPCPPEGKKK